MAPAHRNVIFVLGMKKFVIIHGTKGSPEGNWFPWLADSLRRQHAEVIVPKMPTPEGQNLANWLREFWRQVGVIDQATTLIGHSLGATFLLRVLERQKAAIAQSVFVAGLLGPISIPEYDQLNSTFIETSYDWGTIQRNAGSVVCLSGEDDPYVPAEQGEELAAKLGVRNNIIAHGGHLNAEFGYTSFQTLLALLTRATA
jgi:predicted alpha/beta hydrolase family esterase